MNENTNLIDEHNESLTPIETLSPFKRMVLSLGTLPSAFYDTMTYYESLVYLYEYLTNEVIPTVNNNGDAVEELQTKYIELKSYIDNYFDNLDVQEEINQKLDEMALDGSLTNLIKNYIDPLQEEFENSINYQFNNYKQEVNNSLITIDNKVNSATSGSPAGVYATVTALTSADPDHSKIYLVEEDGKWYYYNGSAWTAGGVYQSTDYTEINDIRIDYLGNLHETAGESVREQVSNLHKETLDLNNYNLSKYNSSSTDYEVHVSIDKPTNVVVEVKGETKINLTNTSAPISPENVATFSYVNGQYNEEVILTGNETWSQRTNTSVSHVTFYSANILPYRVDNNHMVFSNYFKTGNGNTSPINENLIGPGLASGYLTYCYIAINKNELTTPDVTGFKKYLKDKYDNGDPIKVWYRSTRNTGNNYSIIGFIEDDTNNEYKWAIKSNQIFMENSCSSNGLYTSTSVIEGINNLSSYEVNIMPNTASDYTTFSIKNVLSSSIKSYKELLCNRFTTSYAPMTGNSAGNYICGGSLTADNSRYLFISIANSYLSDVSSDTAKINSFKTWITNNPLTIQYVIYTQFTYTSTPVPIQINKSGTFRTYVNSANTSLYGGKCTVNIAETGASYKKKITFIGDSYIANNTQPIYETWSYKFAKKYGMTYNNMGVNGSRICPATNRSQSIYERMTNIPNDSDYIIVCGGHNDATSGIAINDFKTYFTALCEYLITHYPSAKIGFVTPWNQYGNSAVSGATPGFENIINAELEICNTLGIPIFDNNKSGMYMGRSGFQAIYSQGDYGHLNEKGHDLFLNKIQEFLLKL